MGVELHSHPEINSDLNGFGQRLHVMEVTQEGVRVKTERNENDIQDLFSLAQQNAEIIHKLETSVSKLLGKISGVVAAITIVITALGQLLKIWLG
jgi:hypothetical protein